MMEICNRNEDRAGHEYPDPKQSLVSGFGNLPKIITETPNSEAQAKCAIGTVSDIMSVPSEYIYANQRRSDEV
jgi:hypothetical protein